MTPAQQESSRPRRGLRGRGFTGRAAVLAVVACTLVLTLAYPLRQFVAQRAQIHALQQQEAQQERDVRSLEQQRQLLSDPDYIQSQARRRLHFVMPGETGYIVSFPHGSNPDRVASRRTGAVTVTARPWFTRAWDSVRAADGAKHPK